MLENSIKSTGSIAGNDEAANTLLMMLLVVAAWALFHVILWLVHGNPSLDGLLFGTDSYMRMVRIEALIDGNGWYDHRIARSNAPLGEELHWTRPFDVLLIAGAAPLAPFIGWKSALFYAGAIVSPLLQLGLAFAFAWAVRPMLRPGLWLLPTIALLVQPAITGAGQAGRADHHALFLVVFALQWGFLLRSLSDRTDDQSPIWAGALTGFGLWLSTEFLLAVGLMTMGLAVAWLMEPGGRLRQNRRFASAFFFVLVVALLTEYPLSGPPPIALDKVSLVHLLPVAALLAFWSLLAIGVRKRKGWYPQSLKGRLVIASLAATVTLALLYLFAPRFFAGPMADVDPRVVPIWLDRVKEMQPLIPTDRESWSKFIIYLGHVVFSVPYLCWRIFAARRVGERLFWIVLGAGLAAYVGVAVLHVRFAYFAEILLLIPLACFMNDFFAVTERLASSVARGLARGGAMAILIVGPLMFGLLIAEDEASNVASKPDESPNEQSCDIRDVADHLDQKVSPVKGGGTTDKASTILAFMDLGPQILYRTHHRVIGTPYHRNGSGIVHGHRMLATEDEDEARRLVMVRGVDLILLCPASGERGFYKNGGGPNSLYQRLLDGQGPDWIVPVPLPPDIADQFTLYRMQLAPNKS